MLYLNGRFLEQKITGVQRFASELILCLNVMRDDIVVLVSDISKIENSSLSDKLNILEIKGGGGHYWEQVTLVRFLRSQGNPLLLNLCNTAPVFYKNKISTVHDVTFLHYPESYSVKFRAVYKILIPLIIRTSCKVLTVSKFSKKDLCNTYNLIPDNIDVIYNAVSEKFKALSSKDNNKPYALVVSSPNKHKNFTRMIDAFLSSNVSLNLKIVGSLSNVFNTQESKINSDPRIIFLGKVSDEELIDIYQNADFFIFPSLYEGFGIPPLEAQACGCPVISSNAASLPEVLGDSVLYFNPIDMNSIREVIEKVALDRDLKAILIEKGYKNLRRFSWNESAKRLNEIIDKLLSI
jgi:glycosyltransferase involved in cell wall biosynthesis